MITENKVEIKIFVVLDLIIYKGKVARNIVTPERNEGDPVVSYLTDP